MDNEANSELDRLLELTRLRLTERRIEQKGLQLSEQAERVKSASERYLEVTAVKNWRAVVTSRIRAFFLWIAPCIMIAAWALGWSLRWVALAGAIELGLAVWLTYMERGARREAEKAAEQAIEEVWGHSNDNA